MQRFTRWPRRTTVGRASIIGAVVFATIAMLVGLGSALVPISGNIAPNAIAADANLYPGTGDSSGASAVAGPNCTTANFATPNDWVKDCTPLTAAEKAASAVGSDDVATGVVLGRSGASQTGHWQGVRIIDGLNQGDQDIFLTGGKENDVTSWNPGPGSV